MARPTRPTVVVIGASAGGVEALQHLVARLPHRLPATVLVVLHTTPGRPSALVAILSRETSLPVVMALDGQALTPGTILVAPSDQCVVLAADRSLLLAPLPTSDGRGIFDELLSSAAEAYGPAVIGVVLSGCLDGGTSGLHRIRARGGMTMAQDPAEAQVASMPATAIGHVGIDVVGTAAELGERIGLEVGEA